MSKLQEEMVLSILSSYKNTLHSNPPTDVFRCLVIINSSLWKPGMTATPPTFWIEIEILYMLHWYHNIRQNLLQQEKNNQRSQNETLIPMLLTTYLKKQNESLRESGSCPLQRLT